MNKFDKLKDIFSDPLLNDIDKEDVSLFDVPEILKKKARDSSDYVAERKPCEDFDKFKKGFDLIHKELNQGKRILLKYNTQKLTEGTYYITGGVMVYLENIGRLKKQKNGILNGRTRCIFENGTESNLLLDSLRRSISVDGYIITENKDNIEESFQSDFTPNKDDVQDGWIYVLSSLSENPQIKNQKDLYKIGFSTTPVEQRIAGAQSSPTYLMDKVKIEATWKTYNLNTQKFETLIHQFFSAAKFHVEVINKNGSKFRANEWYVVPFGIIKTAINLFKDKSIVDYRYNPSLRTLEKIEHVNSDKQKFDTTGMEILKLIIKKVWFDEIIAGNKDIEFRQLKQTTLNKYTWLCKEDGKRYLKQFDAIRFYVGYHKDRESALVEVLNITYDSASHGIEYHLGKTLEIK